MTGSRIADLMHDANLLAILRKATRRYPMPYTDPEERLQEAWLRIARECEDDDSREIIIREGRLAIRAMYDRARERVRVKMGQNPDRIYRGARGKGRLIPLTRGRMLDCEPIMLDSWLYEGEWAELGLDASACSVKSWYQIIIEETA